MLFLNVVPVNNLFIDYDYDYDYTLRTCHAPKNTIPRAKI